MKALLVRLSHLSDSTKTCGRFLLLDDAGNVVMQAASLELPWRGNMRNVSCIPEGTYYVEKVTSNHFGRGTFALKQVPLRYAIRIHKGNFTRDIKGCILLGSKFKDIDKDGVVDVINSRETVARLQAITDSFTLKVMQI